MDNDDGIEEKSSADHSQTSKHMRMYWIMSDGMRMKRAAWMKA